MPQDRLGAFDALRGLAALAVVLLHLQEVHLTGPLVPHAFLAVDFFFALSGFVMAYTYEAKLRSGLTISAFLMRRLIRLYPMILFGVCFGTFVLGTKLLTDPVRVDTPARILISAVANLFVLPAPYASQASRGVLFVTDGPLWSVAFEILINVIWCVALLRASTRSLAVVVVLSLACLALAAVPRGTLDIGFDWMTVWAALARVGFGFSLGLLAYRLKHHLVIARSAALKAASVVVLLGTFAIPRFESYNLAFDLVGVTILMPMVLLLALNSVEHVRIDKMLGDASYPLYAIHFPILLLASGVHQKMPHLHLGVLLTGTAIFMALATMLVTRLYDEPFRRALSHWWLSHERSKLATPSEVAPKAAY